MRNLCALLVVVALVGCGAKRSTGRGVVAPSTAATPTATAAPVTSAAPTMVAQPAQPAQPDPDAHLKRALALLNQARAKLGYPPLKLNWALVTCALRHSRNFATYAGGQVAGAAQFAHFDWKKGDRCSALAENQGVATGDADTGYQRIFESFLAEGPANPGECNHYGNMMNPAYTEVGIGIHEENGLTWVTQMFK